MSDGDALMSGVVEGRYQYGTQNNKRGIALIISIRDFDKVGTIEKPPSRSCNDADLAALQAPLEKLGFTVHKLYTQSDAADRRVFAGDVEKKLEAVAHSYPPDADCFLCIVMSHGSHGQVFTSDRVMKLDSLTEPFKGNKCPQLAGKPKIFIVQTCMLEPPESTRKDGPTQETMKETIPAEADMLIFWSHIKGEEYVYKKPGSTAGNGGSVFIQIFTKELEVFNKECEKKGCVGEDFLRFCTRVNGAVGAYLEQQYPGSLDADRKLLPFITTTLTKDLFIGPKPRQ